MCLECSRTIRQTSVAGSKFIRGGGGDKGEKGQTVMGCGFCCVPTLHGAPCSFYAGCPGNQRRVPYPCLVQSNFHPFEKPERDLALRGHPTPCSKWTCAGRSCPGGGRPASVRPAAPAATRPHFSAPHCMRVHTDMKGITGHALAEAAFLTCLFIQRTFLGLLHRSGASLGLGAPR